MLLRRRSVLYTFGVYIKSDIVQSIIQCVSVVPIMGDRLSIIDAQMLVDLRSFTNTS